MKLIVNSKEDTYLDHKDTEEVIGYMFYSLNGDVIGYFDKNSEVLPKANYEFVVNVGGKV